MAAPGLARVWHLRRYDDFQYRLLRRFWPYVESEETPHPPEGQARVNMIFGEEFIRNVQGKTVIDFGCGCGHEGRWNNGSEPCERRHYFFTF
jgi:hypothetical protein